MGGWRDGEVGRRGDGGTGLLCFSLSPSPPVSVSPSLPAAACLLPPAYCNLLRRSRRRKQDFLVQVRRRIARDADVLDFFDADTGSFQTIPHRLRRKSRAV